MVKDGSGTGKAYKRGWLAAVAGVVATLILGIAYLLGGGDAVDLDEYPAVAPAVEERAASSGKEDAILVFFTEPQYPDNQADHQGGLDEALAADIARAQVSVDVAAYDLDLQSVTEALLDAHRTGVRVRLVTDSDNAEELQVRQLRDAGIGVVEDGRDAIMHDKFVVIDQQIVWTGSWNLTENGTYRNNNNAVRIDSGLLAENYAVEFEEMFEDDAFGPASTASTPHPRVILNGGGGDGGVLIESYFSPEDRVGEKLVALVRQAEKSIRFMAFAFTDDDLGDAVMEQHAAGLTVQGVFEERGADLSYSEFGRMYAVEPRMDIRLDGNIYMMHHKVIIVDDEIVVLGSFNFSASADEMNDENILFIHDRGIASLFRAEFRRIYGEAYAVRE